MPNKTEKLILEIKIQKTQKFDILNRYGNWGVDRYRFPAYTHTPKSFETHGVSSQQVKVIPGSAAYFYIFQSLMSRSWFGEQSILNKKHGKQAHVIHIHVTAFLSPR